MREITLTQGKITLVDDGDYEWLSQWRWYAHQNHGGIWYAVRNRPRSDDGPAIVRMHREIMGNPPNEIDHINGDGLDNLRSNLRHATHSQNQRNHRKHVGSSEYKGVSWYSRSHKWRTRICINNCVTYLGYYDDELDAARAYDRAALEHFGEFANINFGAESC